MSLMKTVQSNVATTAPKEVAKASKQAEKRLNVVLTVSKHEKFRIACMRNGKSMTAVIDEYIDSYIKANE